MIVDGEVSVPLILSSLFSKEAGFRDNSLFVHLDAWITSKEGAVLRGLGWV